MLFRKRTNKIFMLTFILTLLIPLSGAFAAPKPPEVTSPVAILMDVATGEMIYAQAETERWQPASLTKIMTLYLANKSLAEGAISLNDEVLVSEKAWRTIGSRMFIEVGTKVTVEELFQGITIVSGNDASVAIAEFLAGTEEAFADRMNDKARELGMTGSHFVNSHGLANSEHYSTGLDLAILARQYILDFPEMLNYHSTGEYTYNGIKQQNYNGLLKYPEIDGLKTGHVAGTNNLIATGQKDGYRLLAVILGAQSESERERDAYALLNYGLNNYEARVLAREEQEQGQIRIYKGRSSKLAVALEKDLFVTLLKGDEPELKVDLPEYLEAPINKGDKVGNLIVISRIGEKQYSLVAMEDVPKGNFLKSFFHSIWLAIKNLISK
ncbi:MAG: D-alanyl-D-alanine carboxypeptidase family protein [Bacillota bacterium]